MPASASFPPTSALISRCVALLRGCTPTATLTTQTMLLRQAPTLALTLVSISEQAEELNIALEALGQIYGAVDMEEMLDVVFRDFCIGK